MSVQGKEYLGKEGVSRRDFLKMAGAVAAGLGVGGGITRMIFLDDGMMAIPASTGYLLVDTKKCSGCLTCMMSCSMAHEGEPGLSFSRIQVIRNPLAKFPDDIAQHQCRQCTYPACVEACPTGALHADAKNGHVRMVDGRKCIGCQRCVEACPFTPSRVGWNPERKRSQKCDLCAETPYWDGEGPACASLCPMKAIKFTKEIPTQYGDRGYQVNLRTSAWRPGVFLGFEKP